MKITAVGWAALCIVLLTGPGATQQAFPGAAEYEREILEWREWRVERLKAPFGFLNLVGLYWLEDGVTRIGSADDNDIVFPANAAAHVGELRTSEEGVWMFAHPDAEVLFLDEDAPSVVTSILMSDDTTESPVALAHDSLAWTIIKRDDRFALRLRDFAHPAIDAFGTIEYYDIKPDYRVVATLQPFEEPRVLNVNTTIIGLGYRPESPGKVAFSIGGERQELEAYASGDQLFYVFADATTGRETYPAGRFLYSDWPDEDGKTVLDFNRAYNPPCAYNEFATCPVASPRNRLEVRIEAGEKYDPAIHSTPEGY